MALEESRAGLGFWIGAHQWMRLSYRIQYPLPSRTPNVHRHLLGVRGHPDRCPGAVVPAPAAPWEAVPVTSPLEEPWEAGMEGTSPGRCASLHLPEGEAAKANRPVLTTEQHWVY